MNSIERQRIQLEKRKMGQDLLTTALEPAGKLLASPLVQTSGLFVLINWLQHAEMMEYTYPEDVTIIEDDWSWFIALFPQFSFLAPKPKTTVIRAGTKRKVTYLTEAQANLLRAGLVAIGSGGLNGLSNLIGSVKS